ncbi:hypothetical protein ACIA8O_19140 [Kitasatospora sp. NPDC051853]|uniref:hypothetical protein n=1 Tax=Kitasatospora sp. NPDC051853 TaxID=3364058 RepID=UPI0037B612EC
MRAPGRPSSTPAVLFGALALTATATLVSGGPAVAQPPPLEWVRNGDFHDPLAAGWSCTGSVTVTDRIAEGRPGGQDYAGCSQKVSVVPRTGYDLSAQVSGSYAFVTVSGTGTGSGEVTRWADGPGWSGLFGTVEIGDVNEVTVTFHGWYGQGPYQVGRVSLVGPRYPNSCATASAGPTATSTCRPLPIAP